MRNVILFCLVLLHLPGLATARASDTNQLALPVVGTSTLRILTPTVLELELITTKAPDPARVQQWDFVDSSLHFNPPNPQDFTVKAGERKIEVQRIGFKRRPLYAPLKRRDLRIGNYLYLELKEPVATREQVEVTSTDKRLIHPDQKFVAQSDPCRWTPAIHVNQEGYIPGASKKAMIGYYLGTLGELKVPAENGFEILPLDSTNAVYRGKPEARLDRGYEFSPRPYQGVFEADFSAFNQIGQFRVYVPGMGVSYPFAIDPGIGADLARAYALGLYHQRCGMANELPFTRFTHDPCHLPKAEVPTKGFKAVNDELAGMTGDFASNPRHTAPRLKDVDASLYPFVTTGKVDVAGGHHDAGDYSKYTINSAHLIHALTFAADAIPGIGDLDNLGLPESGDGKSDVLQEAKWEADFLAKMQDADGGFYFLVYPRDREYEDNVTLIKPDCGDPQIVYPKTTAATAAAVAALAQLGSSPRFKQQFPDAAAAYVAKAKLGWAFLQRAIVKYGRDGSYQKITHYGDEFMHDDELAWAATELFLATGDKAYEKELMDHFDPANPNTRRWTWWRLFECYGNAVRSYAFGARTGRLKAGQLNPWFLEKCENEIIAAAQDEVSWAKDNAYGTSFPDASKRFRNAGWYFSADRAFDIAVACQLNYPVMNDPRPKFMEALISNLNYEDGCNPVNVSFLTGIGSKRQHEIVHQFAQNQKRSLPPTGFDIGNIQEGFSYLDNYKKELGALTFPSDGDEKNPYPFYDRWGDSFNTTTEFVTVNLARGFTTCAFLMTQSPAKEQPWKAVPATIEMSTNSEHQIVARMLVPGMNLQNARCVWECPGKQPVMLSGGAPFLIGSSNTNQWIEAEAWLPDGRRAFARSGARR